MLSSGVERLKPEPVYANYASSHQQPTVHQNNAPMVTSTSATMVKNYATHHHSLHQPTCTTTITTKTTLTTMTPSTSTSVPLLAMEGGTVHNLDLPR